MLLWFIEQITNKSYNTDSLFFLCFIGLCSFLCCFIVFPIWINYLKREGLKHQFRKDGPKHSKKEGVPALGGVIIILSTVILGSLSMDVREVSYWGLNLCLILFGFLGFWDDKKKIFERNHIGLTPRKKIILALFCSLILLIVFFIKEQELPHTLFWPFFIHKTLHIPFVFLLFLWFFILLGSSNATNLTDGLDGLLAGSSIPVLLFFLIISFFQKEYNISIFLSLLIGSLLGFLWFNTWPAKIFMGDSGSLAIGGVLGYVAILLKQELILGLVGGVFVIEALSVLLQVCFFKKTQKRLFKMAPIHHHFEHLGYPEQQITIRVWIFSLLLALLGYLFLFPHT